MGRNDPPGYEVQGTVCGVSGTCEGACTPANLGQSYIGCDYYPTVTGNLVSSSFAFATHAACPWASRR